MKAWKMLLKRFITDESGLETVEWAVIAALIVGALLGTIALLGNAVAARFDALRNAVAGT